MRQRAYGKLNPLLAKTEERVTLYLCCEKSSFSLDDRCIAETLRTRAIRLQTKQLRRMLSLNEYIKEWINEWIENVRDQVEGVARFQTTWYHFQFILSQVCWTSPGSDICKIDGKMKRRRWSERAQLKWNPWWRSCTAKAHTNFCGLRWRKKSVTLSKYSPSAAYFLWEIKITALHLLNVNKGVLILLSWLEGLKIVTLRLKHARAHTHTAVEFLYTGKGCCHQCPYGWCFTNAMYAISAVFYLSSFSVLQIFPCYVISTLFSDDFAC